MDGCAKIGESPVQILLRAVSHSTHNVGVGILRIEPDSFRELGDGSVDVLFLEGGPTSNVMIACLLRSICPNQSGNEQSSEGKATASEVVHARLLHYLAPVMARNLS